MKNSVLILLIGIISLFIFSCSPKLSEYIVADFGNTEVTLSDFEKAYAKNVGGIEHARQDSLENYKKFLDLYLNFRMKLRNAEVRGYPSDESIISELNDYKKQVGASYVTEREIVIPGLRKLYDRGKDEIRISHIMIQQDSMVSNPKETAEMLIDSLNAGADFSKYVDKYSKDGYSKKYDGDLYWVTSGQILPNIEEAIYSTPVGEICSKPIPSQYGYHILKVTDRQPIRYKLKASHILIKATPNIDSTDSAGAYYRINEIYNKIINGQNFEELAKQYSEDQGTAANGGDLGYFSRRRMVKAFDEVVFNMKVGEISKPVKTNFGYHIIKLVDEQPYPSFEDQKEELRQKYKRSTYDDDYKSYIDSLKKKYNYSINQNLINGLVNMRDTVLINNSYWNSYAHEKYGNDTVISVGKKSVILDSLFAFAISDRQFVNKKVQRTGFIQRAADKLSDQLVLEERALNLDAENQEFADLMKDYKNGIYIFRLQEDEVWDKLILDSNEVKNFYEQNSENYKYNDRVEYAEILVRQDSLAKAIYEQLKSGSEFDTLAAMHTTRSGFKSRNGRYDISEVAGNELAEIAFGLNKPGDFTEPFKTSGGFAIIKLIEKYPARPKTFEEAKPEVSSDYQEVLSKKLEQDYIDRLTKLYKPEKYYEVLERAFKENKFN
ncbi:MAG: peptidylprolyl isomerase [Melioribacteraceae bacterium]|nr:peptidylprolyl isomerase [Melioribacteraceae bacterium]